MAQQQRTQFRKKKTKKKKKSRPAADRRVFDRCQGDRLSTGGRWFSLLHLRRWSHAQWVDVFFIFISSVIKFKSLKIESIGEWAIARATTPTANKMARHSIGLRRERRRPTIASSTNWPTTKKVFCFFKLPFPNCKF